MGLVINATTRRLYHREPDPVAILQEVGWGPGPVWKDAENLAPTGILPPPRPVRGHLLYRPRHPGLPYTHKHDILVTPGMWSPHTDVGAGLPLWNVEWYTQPDVAAGPTRFSWLIWIRVYVTWNSLGESAHVPAQALWTKLWCDSIRCSL